MKMLSILFAGLVGIILIVESSLRIFFGFGNPPLYIADEKIGYLLAPNQKTRRRGNLIKINQYSMRSEEIALKKPKNSIRIFMLGDSIVNGGWWTDQNNILSASLEAELTKILQPNIKVFNASANSWSPRNELAYLKRFGLFKADILVLVINTDDLFGTTPNSFVVGKDKNYPDTKPPLALIELYQRYIKRPQPIPELEPIKQEGGDRVGFNLEAISQIKAIANKENAEFVLALTPLLRELEEGSRDYEKVARKRLQELVDRQNTIYFDFLPLFADFPQPEFLYRDRIHLSPQGETIVSQKLSQIIQETLSTVANKPLIKE